MRDRLVRFSTVFDKGDNFSDFLLAFLDTSLLLNRDLLEKERLSSPKEVYSKRKQYALWCRPYLRQEQKQF